MKKKKIILIVIIIGIILISFVLGVATKSNQVENDSINTKTIKASEKLKEEHNFKDIVISDLTLKKVNNYTNLTFAITNNSEESFSDYSLKIHFYDENNKEKESAIINIGTLEKNAKKLYSEQLLVDCTDSYDFSFEKIDN